MNSFCRFVHDVHQAVQIAAAQHHHVAGLHQPELEAALPIREFAPIADDHHAAPLHHEEHFGIVSMPVQPDARERLDYMQIGVIHREERFVPPALLTERVEVPGFELPSDLGHASELAVRGEQVAVVERSDAAVRIRARPHAQELVPTALDHRKFEVVVGSAERIPNGAVGVRPGDLEMERQNRVHRIGRRNVRGRFAVERLAREVRRVALHEVGPRHEFSRRQRIGGSPLQKSPPSRSRCSPKARSRNGSNAHCRARSAGQESRWFRL